MSEVPILAPFAGTVVAVRHALHDPVVAGQAVVVLEAMKMEHEVLADVDGDVVSVEVAVGDTVERGQRLAVLMSRQVPASDTEPDNPSPTDPSRAGRSRTGPSRAGPSRTEPSRALPSQQTGTYQYEIGTYQSPRDARDDPSAALQEVRTRHEQTLDAARPDAVAKRHELGRRTARENLNDLIDQGSFVEYGPMIHAAQERRRPREELIERTPADGLVAGTATIDGAPAVVMSYDYTVLAGTQGMRNHLKKDRLFEIAERRRLPVVLLAEGGGGRPGDVDWPHVAGLDVRAFHLFAHLSGLVPLVGIASGYCFAGNAALLGCCDVVIATEDSSIGMGGPAMIEGGGLGVYDPKDVGPIEVQFGNGVVDLRVEDEPAAIKAARRYLSYFTRPAEAVALCDADVLRSLIPSNRKRVYDIRAVIDALLDDVLELRAGLGPGIVTALARADQGNPLGVIANNPAHLGGAIDATGADKAARFMQLCDAFDLPILFLCDTPGFMVGPEAEKTATVRHFGRLFLTGSNLTVPTGTIVLRKGYGLGAQAMAGGSFKAPLFTIAWPTAEFGGMGLEGAVRLGMRRELDAIEDGDERERAYNTAVAAAYEKGKGINMAAYFEIDDVIDPADSRRWIQTLFDPPAEGWRQRAVKRRPYVDAW
ncbi:MAG TPA: carboxyl transferase domain-containing protein [Solirubrobacteraceae bacterium]|nr:carboxyl transferase domain-containing protein [Solirubrobacteraceae bacterium]